MTLEDVKAFYREHFVRGNIVIGLAGGYPADFPAKVRSDFEKLPAGFTPRLPLSRPRAPQGLEFVLVEKPTATPAISIGFPIDRTKSEKAAWALRITAAHFNDVADHESDKQADFAEPTLARRQKNFSIRIWPSPSDNIHFLIRRTLRELRSVAENGFSDERFQNLRTALLGLLDRDASSPETRLIRQMALRNDGYDFSANAREILAGLTLKDVNKSIRKYLRAEDAAIVVIAPGASDLRDGLLSNTPSPNSNSGSTSANDRPGEDAAIRLYPLAVKPENIRIIPAGEFFLKAGNAGLGDAARREEIRGLHEPDGKDDPWTAAERAVFKPLDTPTKIQLFLNGLDYDPEPGTASPRLVLRDRKANCFEGAMFAAAAFRFHGQPPLIVDMRSYNDDDHVLAVFRQNNAWGCVANRISRSSGFASPFIATSAS